MDAGFVENFGGRWQDAVNRHAVEEILELCAEDIRMDAPGLDETAAGRQAVSAFFERTWNAFPDLRFTRPEWPYYVASDAPLVVARWSAHYTMRGMVDPPGYASTNSPVDLHGIDLWVFNDGLLIYSDGIYDSAGNGRQIVPCVLKMPPVRHEMRAARTAARGRH